MVSLNQPPVYFHFLKQISLPDRGRLKRFLVTVFKKEKTNLEELRVIFCSDSYLLHMNRQYLHHNYYTDIITFNLSNNPKQVNGELYISIDRVRENAKTQDTSFKEEVHRVIFHGVLHLCGYKDKKSKDKLAMTKAENKYLGLFFS